eukprot:1942688-Amphidinium_carterae.1
MTTWDALPLTPNCGMTTWDGLPLTPKLWSDNDPTDGFVSMYGMSGFVGGFSVQKSLCFSGTGEQTSLSNREPHRKRQ